MKNRVRNLQMQIDSYGYDFSMGKYMVSVLTAAGGACMCGMFFSLNWYWILLIMASVVCCLPGMVADGYKNMYEHRRFLDLADYMEQMLYSFKMNQKILMSLKDTEGLFAEGRMKDCIQRAIAYIEAGESQQNLYQEALELVEQEYPNRRLRALHAYLRMVEGNGGDCEESINLLLEDKDIWAENVLLLQEDKKAARLRVIVALGITIGLAAVFHGVYRSMPVQYSIVEHPVTQSVTACYLCVCVLIFRRAGKEISRSWIEQGENQNQEAVCRYLAMIQDYDEQCERKKSILCAMPAMVFAVISGIRSNIYAAAVFAVLAVFLLNQHKIGYRIAYGRVVKEINMCFPQWLMALSLLLQGNNVQVAIEKSKEDAPAVLQGELEKLQRGLEAAPYSAVPYMEFFSIFRLSSVQSAMKMLYAVSEAGTGDTRTQVRVMVQRNHKMLDKSEKMINERSMAGISTMFYLPQLTVSFQMMTNMVVFMIVFLQQMKL